VFLTFTCVLENLSRCSSLEDICFKGSVVCPHDSHFKPASKNLLKKADADKSWELLSEGPCLEPILLFCYGVLVILITRGQERTW
jgi:hypothetical protein